MLSSALRQLQSEISLLSFFFWLEKRWKTANKGWKFLLCDVKVYSRTRRVTCLLTCSVQFSCGVVSVADIDQAKTVVDLPKETRRPYQVISQASFAVQFGAVQMKSYSSSLFISTPGEQHHLAGLLPVSLCQSAMLEHASEIALLSPWHPAQVSVGGFAAGLCSAALGAEAAARRV